MLVSSSIESIFSERMAFIGCFPVSRWPRPAGVPPHVDVDVAIRASDFDHIAANMRQ
jgi:hypothetical protein